MFGIKFIRRKFLVITTDIEADKKVISLFSRALFEHVYGEHLHENGIKMLLETSRFHFGRFRNFEHFADFSLFE